MEEAEKFLSPKYRKVVGFSIIGLILIFLGIKFTIQRMSGQVITLIQNGTPVLLFYNIAEPCQCSRELVARANTQIVMWPEERRGGVKLVRLNFGEDREMEAKYKVFRAPALVLLDGGGEIVWRQDYPLSEGDPFKIEELEAALAELGTR